MSQNPQRPSQTDTSGTFGYRAIDPAERQGLVNGVFSAVAERYDVMNDLMSGGLHRLWKADLVTMMNPPTADGAQFHALDLAGGTGDVALRIVAAGGSGVQVTLADISPEMVSVAERRIAAQGLTARVACHIANAETLPFAARTFDAATIAFGIRNVTRIDVALKELYRVLKPGGRFLCLEFSRVDVPLLDRIYDLHSFEVIPRLGQLVAGDAESYRYLVESIRKFPDQETFAGMIRAAGFERVTYRNLTGGVAAIHSGWRI
jgi:demethylmenaquinone methyltransferase / 2-methoxy-6-polyprenyl-1,4-benzoquinol methylase